MTDFCNACGKPFDEVHPFDFLNDLMICAEMHEGPCFRDKTGYPLKDVCTKRHTWRQHVAESFDGKWFNPHFRVAERPAPQKEEEH